jgi:hypothetical protein
MNKKIIIAAIIIIIAGIGCLAYQSNTIPSGGAEKERACLDSGGTVTTGWCWRSGENLSNTCPVGVCDCPPGFLNHLLYGRKVKFCDCGAGKCFDGEKCAFTLVADELRECLPKSDAASHERCLQLLANIKNFDECVAAGFAIMKSNPPQCQALDGPIFTQETNSTWEQAVLAINNCEVAKVFQKHSRIVTLTLKNGNILIAIEPEIDAVITIIEATKLKCGKIQMGTE